MSNQLTDLLHSWYQRRDEQWVLGTVYKTQGSAYRKAGAMMLIDANGRHFGMLSGGCLESDIVHQARKVLLTGETRLLEYDGSDEDDLSFQLGIGCGGKVFIMLQALGPEDFLEADVMYRSLRQRIPGRYMQKIGSREACFEAGEEGMLTRSVLETREDGDWLVTPVLPPPHLLVVGGGLDAMPVVNMAAQIGWQVSLADPRPANARPEYFPAASTILRDLQQIEQYIAQGNVNAMVIMTHNVDLDAEALRRCQDTAVGYVALLGPRHRYKKVLERAGLQEHSLSLPVSAPAGLAIGGQLPESIALSIIAECHAMLHERHELPALGLAVV